MKHTNRLLSAILFLLDYVPIFATVTTAVVFSLWANSGQQRIEPPLQWILIVLTLLATTQLIDRLRLMRKLDKRVNEVADSLLKLSGSEALIGNRMPDLTDRIRKARSIAMSGLYLSRSGETHWSQLKRRLQEGVPIRIILSDSKNTALHSVLGNMMTFNRKPKQIKGHIERSLTFFENLYPEIGQDPRSGIRMCASVVIYGIWLFDINTDQAEIWVEIYSYREPDIFPTLHLLPHQDGKWFQFFVQQFETMWEASRVWVPETKE